MGPSKNKSRKVAHDALAVAAPLATGSADLGTPTLTVGQIVQQLGPPTPDAAATSERVRHWTREGLLVPVDQHHAGTGRHRRYGPDAVYEAAVLNALATAGLQLVSRPYIHSALTQVRAALRRWQQAESSRRKIPAFFLVISHDMSRMGGEPTASIEEGNIKDNATAEIAIVLNLSRLFSRVQPTAEYLEDQNARRDQNP